MTAEITQLGLTEVDEAYHKAKEHLIYAEEQLKRAHLKVDRLKKCSECSHPKESLEDVGAHIYSQTRCKECGFTWTD